MKFNYPIYTLKCVTSSVSMDVVEQIAVIKLNNIDSKTLREVSSFKFCF